MRHKAKQDGFLLIAAVVLIVVGAVLAAALAFLVVAQNQGASDQVTGKQALFLAESGLERAIQRFSTGTACDASLVETVSNPFGQEGSFQIVSASSVGALCRIRAQGTLGSSDRIVEADVSAGFVEHFPSAVDFTNDWTITQQNGAGGIGGHSTTYGDAPGSSGGHVFASSDPTGDNDRFRFTVERSLGGGAFVAQAGVPINVTFYWRKTSNDLTGTRPHLLELNVGSSGGGGTVTLWSDNNRLNMAAWQQQIVSVLPPPALVGRTVDILELKFDMRENNLAGNPNLAVAGGFDFIQFGGGATVVAWREIYP